MKHDWKPGTMIYPLPAVMVSCGNEPSEYNIITVAWVGTICTNPAMCYISVRPERFSYPILKKNMEFVINLTNRELAYATDWCGVNSGKDHHKFEEMKLTPGKATVVNAPTIDESPLCIECRVKEVIALGSHDMFIADVVNVQADDRYLDPETGAFDMQKADLLAYSHGKYYGLGEFVGKFGWSVKKKKLRYEKSLPYRSVAIFRSVSRSPELHAFRGQSIQLWSQSRIQRHFPSHKLPFHQWEGSGEYRHRI